jgi:hypothetical protein
MTMHNFHHSTLNPLEYEAKYMKTDKQLMRQETSLLSLDHVDNGKLLQKNTYFQEYYENDFLVYKSINLTRERTLVSGRLQMKTNTQSGMFSTTHEYEFIYIAIEFLSKKIRCSTDQKVLKDDCNMTSWEGKNMPFLDVMLVEYD